MSLTDTTPAFSPNRRVFAAVSFTLTIFLSATLLFFVQPLFAKMVLPKIGGAPAVWTTAMLFFQVVLIAGYVYAHLLIRYVPARLQLPIHLAFWAAALTFLPLSASEGWQYDPAGSTTLQTLELFALGVGVPFAMLAANAPLLQAWYVRSGGPSADDPYFLYGASNIGSLLALLAFPLLAEPNLGASQIGLIWAGAFVVFGGLMAVSGAQAARPAPALQPTSAAPADQSRPTLRQIGLWIFIAFVPSSLMLAITTKISTDLGALPLIWVIPLALYILSFVVAFSKHRLLTPEGLRRAAIIALAACAILMSNNIVALHAPISALIFAPALYVVAVFAHRLLYDQRPAAAHLTVFYVCMSVGGAVGGLFNSVLAPALFNDLREGPVTVVLAALLIATTFKGQFNLRLAAYGILISALALLSFKITRDNFGMSVTVPLLLTVIAFFAGALAALHKAPKAIATALVGFFLVDAVAMSENYLFKDRSFFGAHKVYDRFGLRRYVNGTTMHGYQRINELDQKPTPLAYYHPQSPMAQIIKSDFGVNARRVGVVGLGVGSLACYAQPGQTWDFYEIDEMVDRVARDPALFGYMPRCAADTTTHLGDARIVLEGQDFKFDVLYLDAYSSDSIPMHLLTQEAVALYRARLSRDGVMVFHISNRYYDIAKPLARITARLGLSAAQQDGPPGPTALGTTSQVVVVSPDPDRIADILQDTRWQPLAPRVDGRVWTDDFANPLSALRLLER